MAPHSGLTRRQFLIASVAAGTALSVPWYLNSSNAYAFYQSPAGLRKFAQPLRGVYPLDPQGIPVAIPDAFPAPVTGAAHYSLAVAQYTDQLHPNLSPTTLFGYRPAQTLGGSVAQRHLGGIIVAQKGTPVQVTVTNMLPNQHMLPVDTSTLFADAAAKFGGTGVNAITTHLHGGLVPWISDGGPETWFTPQASGGTYGPSTAGGAIYRTLNPGLQAGQGEYYYPNNQSARLLWYHDHAHDITRLNAYSGIASAYIIRDAYESDLRNLGLPDFIENGGRELPIVIQDKIFVGANIALADPTWTGVTSPGSLWYPHTYEHNRWKWNSTGGAIPEPSVIPEMFGDTMLANGTVFPEAAVEARRYRLRVLNACQARFLNLQLYVDDGSADGITLNANTLTPTNAKGPDFLVLGTEGGFLPSPVLVPSNVPFNAATMSGSLITGPAERWDLLVDFSGYAGKKLILYTDAPAPFPMGDPRNDYFPGAPKNATISTPGYGPNTRQILRFNVGPATSADPSLQITTATPMPGLDPFLVPPGTAVQNGAVNLPPGVPVRQLTLNEDFDIYGRLIQTLGTNVHEKGSPYSLGRAYMDPATETPSAGATEIWQIANTTGDTHPIHFHLVNVQLLSRQSFKVSGYTRTPTYTGPARGPDSTELGWKETVRMNPGEVTTVIMQFNLPVVPFSVPSSPRTGGNEYVWHCHILEHEEHDMMRPLIVN